MEDEAPSRLSRARIALSRRALDALLSSPRVVARLSRKRSAPIDGRTFDAEMAAVCAVDDLDAGSDLRKLSTKAARAKFAEQIAIVDREGPRDVSVGHRTIAGLGGTIALRTYVPEALAGKLPTVVYFHGGGYVLGDLSTHDGLCRRVAIGARARVVAVHYRRAPEDRFPAALDDGITAVRWVLEHADELGVDASRVALAGDSAGGNLSAVVSLRLRGDARRPALQCLIYPATDARCEHPSHTSMGEGFLLTREMIDWYYDQYLGPDRSLRSHPDVSPLLAPDVSGAPPALVFTAGFDPLRDEGAAYAEKLRAAGVKVTYEELSTLPHGFVSMTRGPVAARLATDRVVRLLGEHLRGL